MALEGLYLVIRIEFIKNNAMDRRIYYEDLEKISNQ